MKLPLIIPVFLFISAKLVAQSDSAIVASAARSLSHHDSLHLAKLNTSGTLMIAGGVGLWAAGSYFIYEGVQVYNSPPDAASTDPAADIKRNHNQGTIFMTAGCVTIAGGVILAAFGIKNKIDFKRGLKHQNLQAGILPDGNLGAVLNF